MDIRFDSVRVVRGDRVTLQVSELTVRGSRVTALLGPNGSGKTTLLRAIAALDRTASGRVLLGGQPARPDRTTRESIAFAFQSPVFVMGTVRANIELGLRLRRVGDADRVARTQSAAAALEVGHLLERDARTLSGGEAQRVNLARALALRAPVTLLDEPLAGLDAPSRETLLRDLPRILGELNTVVIVTHDRAEAARLAEDVVLLIDGKVCASGPLPDLFTRPPDLDSARFLGWTLVPGGDEIAAVRPGSLVLGPGERQWRFDVAQVLEVGSRWEVFGSIAQVPATLRGRGSPPQGGCLEVSASAIDVRSFPRDDQKIKVPDVR